MSVAPRSSIPPAEHPSEFKVVGIGASAGGLESLEQFFANLPPNPGMAFVVIQHLSPDFRSMMDELLSRHSDMPVRLAEHDIEVQANHVYLLPPRKDMVIQNRRLLLTEKEPIHGFTLPIDQFLRSLAKDIGPDAIAIILSGSGSDGSRGIADVKRAGGRVFVESPDSAKFDGMPLSALATGMVDRTGAAREIPKFLTEAESSQQLLREFRPDESPMETVLRLLRDHFGLDFSLYKTSTVSRRILRRVELLGAMDLAEYAESLLSDTNELSSLYRDLLIGVTQFFRDPEAFEFLEKSVVPDLLRTTPENEEIRIWVAGCATGEEAYSMAMILFEQLGAAGRQLNVKILATDVHGASLAAASQGLYGEEQLQYVNDARRERFFRKKPTGYQISQDLRQLIVFAPHNITKDAPFTKIHLVSCRNLLIYLEPHAQKSVLSLFHFGLVRGGYLFLGSSETPGPLANEFDTIDEHTKIYRKRRDVRLMDTLRVPATRKTQTNTVAFLGQTRSNVQDTHLLGLYDQLLDRYMPPSFMVNEDRQLVDSFGGAERLFRLTRRRPSINVLELLEGDLRTVVAGAIQRALKDESPVRYTGVPVPYGDETRRCVISAQALINSRTHSTHVLISIENESPDVRRDLPADSTEDVTTGEASNERLETLEGELSYTRETLQSTIEELQTSNEELQATNEELVASNEELQSTNEELHSVNEELYTVNSELQRKIIELRELNSDMQHFLESTDVGILFLDRNLGIRKYTPRIAGVFHIEAQDVGRNIRHFSHNLKRPNLEDEIERALRDGLVVEDEVRDGNGTTFFLRVLPYRPSSAAEGISPRIEGVVLSLTDISVLDRARSRLAQVSAIVDSSKDAIIGKSLEGVITTWNHGAQQLYGYAPAEAIGRHISILAPPGTELQLAECLDVVRKGNRIEQLETTHLRKDGSVLNVSVTISPVYDSGGDIVGASSIARDITQLKKIQDELAEGEARIRLLLESTAEAIIGLGPDGRCTFVNPACIRMLGRRSSDQIIGSHIHALVHPNDAAGSVHTVGECPLSSALVTGQGMHSDDEVFSRADGSSFLAEYWSYPIRRGQRIVGIVVTFIDITERKHHEDEIRTAARRREEFLAMLSHELRNPLSAVVSATKVLHTPHIDSQASSKAREVIERQTQHMSRLLDDLLDVSRITRGGIELRKGDVDLRDVVRVGMEALAPAITEKKSEVIVDLPSVPAAVRGDYDRLQQVVVNLLTNAVRYSPPEKRIWISVRIEDQTIILSVRDEGRGISPSMLTEIFDLFVQNEQGLERSSGGLGIGLTLVRKIVELHGGSVEARSAGSGAGSEFIVKLPHQTNAVLRSNDPVRAETTARRILVVEDQEDAREMMCMLLQSRGHVLLEAADGKQAIDAIEQHHPDIALIDIGLPVISGYDVARKIRENPVFDDVVLVALTGYGRDSDLKAAKTAGFDEHLTKPAEIEEIDEIVKRHARGDGNRSFDQM